VERDQRDQRAMQVEAAQARPDQHDTEWAIHVAIGDAATVVLAWLAVAALRARHRAALPAVWLFNLVGFADLISAFRNAVAGGLPVESLGAQALIIAIGPPALLVGHLAIFAILLRGRGAMA
jgi:hypothetical protein